MTDEPTLVTLGELQLVHPPSPALPCDVCGAPARFLLHKAAAGADDSARARLCDEDFRDQLSAAEEVLEHGARWLRLLRQPRVPGQRDPGQRDPGQRR